MDFVYSQPHFGFWNHHLHAAQDAFAQTVMKIFDAHADHWNLNWLPHFQKMDSAYRR